jgi:hypothetical protein
MVLGSLSTKGGAESHGKTLILMLSSLLIFELYFLGKETMKKK